MRVLFISRATLFSVRGGDTVQIESTAIYLRRIGVEVDIRLADSFDIDYSLYDLIHFFNLTRPADIIHHIERCDLPFVTSPIYVDFGMVYHSGKEMKYRLMRLAGRNTMEYFRTVGRWLVNGEKVLSLRYLCDGHRRSMAYILNRCGCLLPNSYSELQRLRADFGETGRFCVIPNGIDTGVFQRDPEVFRMENSVLCAARFEPRKNQLNIIKALAETGYSLTLVGDVAPNHRRYFDRCRAQGAGRVIFLPFCDQPALARLYQQHQVHILASWFETTGLSSLEAASCGCNIVVSDKGDTREYFEGVAEFCDPGSCCSIRKAVARAMQSPFDNRVSLMVAQEYRWETVAIRTKQAYMSIL